MKEGVGAGGGPEGAGAGVGAGEGAAPGTGVALLPPRISPLRTDGMSVRNSIFRTAERAMPPKIATIGFQMPRPRNFIFVTPAGASNSSDSIATFGRSPLPRTTSFPSDDLEAHPRDARRSRASASMIVRRVSLHLERVLGNRRDASRDQVRLDVELAVLDQRAQPVERFRHVRAGAFSGDALAAGRR